MRTVEHRTLYSATLGLIQFVLTFIQSILLVPLLLSHWGQEKYGIYITIFAFIQILRTIDLGHQTFIGNEYNRVYFIDKDKAQNILSSSLMTAMVLGGIELVVFLVLWWSGSIYSLVGFNQFGTNTDLLGILFMVIMWWIVGSASGVMARSVLTKGLYAAALIWAIVLKAIEIIFLFLAAIYDLNLFTILWIWAGINLVFNSVSIQWLMKKLEIKFSDIRRGNWKTGFQHLKKSIVLTLNNSLEQLNSNGIVFLITHFISLAIIPVYSTLRTITNTFVQLSGLIISPLQPELIRYESGKSGEKINSVIRTVWTINGGIINIILILLIPFISWIYGFWTNHQLVFNKKLFFMLCLSMALANFGRILIVYLTGINDLKAITYISISRVVIVFGGAVLFIYEWGILAIGFAFVLAELVSSVILPLWLTNRVLHKKAASLLLPDIWLGICPILILSICYLLDVIQLFPSGLIVFLGLLVMLMVYFLQWKKLQDEVKFRLKSLSLQLIRRAAWK